MHLIFQKMKGLELVMIAPPGLATVQSLGGPMVALDLTCFKRCRLVQPSPLCPLASVPNALLAACARDLTNFATVLLAQVEPLCMLFGI